MNIIQLVWRNSWRKKSRAVLTCASILVAFYLFSLLSAINHAVTNSVSSSSQQRLMTTHKVSITRSLPVNYQQKMASLNSIAQVTYASWFGGFYQNEKNQLAMIAVDHPSYFDLYPQYQLTQTELSQWQRKRDGLIIGQAVADKYGWKKGDNISLSSSIWMNKAGLFDWQFTLVAIYKTKDTATSDKQLFFQHKYFDNARAYASNSASWLISQGNNNTDIDKLMENIDALFNNSAEATRTTTEQVFIKEQAQQFVDMAMVIKLVVIAVFFTLLLIVCNTMMQTNRERLNESAMMKAIGFSSSYLVQQLFLESLLLLTIGAILGCLLANISLVYIAKLFADFLPGIAISTSHYIIVTVLVFIAASVCSLVPAYTIKTLNITNTLGARA